jgi:hypothetical protein
MIGYKKNISISRVLSNVSFAMSLYQYLSKELKAGDKVYLNAIPPEVLFAISLLKKKCNIEVIVDVRDIWPDALVNQKKKNVLVNSFAYYCRFLYGKASRSIDKYVYVAPSFKSWITKYNKRNKPMLLSPLGYDENRWVENIEEEDILLKDDRVNMVYVGYLSNQFDLEQIIDYMNDSKRDDITFHIIGGGEKFDYYKSKVRNRNVTFYGMKSPQFVSKNLSRFDIGLLPLRRGAASFLPNKYFDYIAAKIPIIAYGSKDVGALIKAHDLGWYIETPDSDLVKALDSIDKESCYSKKQYVKRYNTSASMQHMNANIVSFIES